MTEDEGLISVEFTILAMVHMIYYGDVTLGCTAGYLTMKTTYNYVLYLFVDSSVWNEVKFQAIEVTIASHVISEFKF